ncbi:hypothetical protein DCAR_0833145 [Daucus carota subsp. sativus]|uniref:Uncharacterized protein n=1 Tax=Daucus carota subsp. sativus TaxID=79200 RepID=A0A175YS72_DAUCS|nr:hypothetical protein DCAR_0833145 [Daucus carota subsp. sativus]
MVYSKKSVKKKGVIEAEVKKWVLTSRADNKQESDAKHDQQQEEDEEICTTPTSDESRIPSSRFIQCPGAPRKRKCSSKKHQVASKNVVSIEFFSSPELEKLFVSSVYHQRP